MTIVGAGPAGSLAALKCARAGLDVVLVEKEKMPRFKACGGGFELEYLDLLRGDILDIDRAIEKKPEAVELFYRKSKISDVPFKSCSFGRDGFDFFLARKAQKAGATFLNGDGCIGFVEKSDFVKVRTVSGRLFISRVLIGADGAGGLVGRALGLSNRPNNNAVCIDLEAHLPEKSGLSCPRIFLGYSGSIPGYAWAFPKRNVLSLGIGTSSPNPGINGQFSTFLKENGFHKLKAVKRLGAVLPMGILPRTCRGRVLLAGDAAGFVDSLGGGIPYALESGRIAARVIEEAFEARDISWLLRYDLLCRKAFMPRFALAWAGAGLLRAFLRISNLSSPFW